MSVWSCGIKGDWGRPGKDPTRLLCEDLEWGVSAPVTRGSEVMTLRPQEEKVRGGEGCLGVEATGLCQS
jgi:hypothetical protein